MPTVDPIDPAADDPHSRRLRHVMAADTTEVTDEQIRNARHAYLANCSYVDHWVGEIQRTLDIGGMADNTIVIFTADHGDMLGERGLWYKMSFFEHSTRIPLIVSAPGRFSHREVATHTSLLDIAPTLADLAGANAPEDLDGASLVPLLDGDEDPDRTVAGEYLGEGAVAPIFMLRRGALKYIWSQPDGAQLFNLDADPNELTNLATAPDQVDTVAEFDRELHQRWDPTALRAEVLANQRSRRTVDQALRQGRFTPWDFQPTTDAAQQYMRNHLDLNQVESGRRLS